MSSKCSCICQNGMFTDMTIVCNMHISHNQNIVANRCFHSVGSTFIYGTIFTDGNIVADYYQRFFTGIFHILRNSRNYGARKYFTISSDSGTFHYGNMRTNPGSFANFDIVMNGNKGFDTNVLSYFSPGMYIC